MADKMESAVLRQINLLRRELKSLEEREDAPIQPHNGDQYRFDITVAPGAKPQIRITSTDVVTTSCATACGTCMADSCYTC